jgi:hypothetical protein
MDEVARVARAQGMAVDVLFGGYRSWSLYPRQYPSTSVARYLLFVPPALREARQRIMNDANDLIDTAERFGARVVVPYADGGAPWYSDIGLGPGAHATSHDHFDPVPEVVAQAARRRSNVEQQPVPSPVAVQILRPGQHLSSADGRPSDLPGHAWPASPSQSASALLRPTVMTEAELIALARKKVLLRILAAPELERLGLAVGAPDVQRLIDDVRRTNGLTSAQKMREWMQAAQLDPDAFGELMYEWAGIVKLEAHYRDEIDEMAEGQIAFGTMRGWLEPS